MKILHITDIHGDMPALQGAVELAKQKDLEVICVTGDILGQVMPREQVHQSYSAFQVLYDFMRKFQMQGEFSNLLAELKFLPSTPPEITRAALAYSNIENQFIHHAEQQYSKSREILRQFPGHVLAVPGNWDTTAFFDYFGDFGDNKHSAHLKSWEIKGIKFAGYGGAPERAGAVPPSLDIQVSAEELYGFIMQEEPNIVLTHIPPFSLCDRTPRKNDVTPTAANFAALACLRTVTPDLWLCGHMHQGMGYVNDRYSKTFVINSGNLGKYNGEKTTGIASLIELDANKFVTSFTPYLFSEKGVEKLVTLPSCDLRQYKT